MIQATKNYFTFLWRCARIAFDGDWRYYAWMGLLTVLCLVGLNAYAKQFVNGLMVTGMSDQVSWGVYIANFTFLVGVAAAAVMLVIPVYIYRNEERGNASNNKPAVTQTYPAYFFKRVKLLKTETVSLVPAHAP